MQHVDRAVAGVDVPQLDDGRAVLRFELAEVLDSAGARSRCVASPRRGTRPAPPRSAWISSGVPSAIITPKSSTWITSQVPITNDMSCSTSSTATPSAATCRMTSPTTSVSSSVSPDEHSSQSSTFGRVVSARHSSTSRAIPVGRVSTRCIHDGVEPDEVDHTIDVADIPTRLGRHLDVLADGQRVEHLQPLEGAGQAEARTLVRGGVGDVAAADDDPTRLWRLQASDHVEQRGLARPVRTDEPGDLPCFGRERHVAEGHEPAEANRDAGDVEDRHQPVVRSSAGRPRRSSMRRSSPVCERLVDPEEDRIDAMLLAGFSRGGGPGVVAPRQRLRESFAHLARDSVRVLAHATRQARGAHSADGGEDATRPRCTEPCKGEVRPSGEQRLPRAA